MEKSVANSLSRAYVDIPKFDFEPKAQGIYIRRTNPVAYVISFTDLPEDLVPEELRAFCDPVRRRQTFMSCYGNEEKAPIVETIFDLYESEVTEIMLNIREESLKNIVTAVGSKKILAALGKEEILSALSDEDLITALRGRESLIRKLLPTLEPEQLRRIIKETAGMK